MSKSYCLLFLVVILIGSIKSQDNPRCFYGFHYDDTYYCHIFINNPSGLDNFTSIDGIHADGMSNSDVQHVFAVGGIEISKNIPSIICNTFRFVQRFEMFTNGVEEVGSDVFKNCPHLTEIKLGGNKISKISGTSLAHLTELNTLDLSGNQISELPQNIFGTLSSLRFLQLQHNNIAVVPSNWFSSPKPNLRFIDLMFNKVDAVDERIVNIFTGETSIFLYENPCAPDFHESPWDGLRPCFDNFRRLQGLN